MNVVVGRAVFGVCLTLILALPAAAATRIVDDDGAQCAGAPFTTITAALAAANPTGDTIQVCDGTYAEGTIVVAKEVVIDGVNRDATLVNVIASSTFGFQIQASNVTISDLVIQEIGGAGVTGANGIRFQSGTPLDNEVVSNVIIRDFLDGSARGIEISSATMNDLTITNSTFSNNLYGIRLNSSSHVDGLVLTGSSFTAPANAADFTRIGLYQANDGSTSTFRDLQASGNTFTNLSLAGIFLEELQDSVIATNQFTGNYTGIIIDKRYASSGVPVSNVSIATNTFTNQTGRAVFLSALTLGLGADVSINDNVINVGLAALFGPSNRGAITTNFQSTLTHAPLTISGNTLTFTGAFTTATSTWGVQLAGDGPVVIEGNTFQGNGLASSGTPPFAAIYLQSNSSTLGARNDAVTITCNDITGFVHGITVYDPVAAQGGNLPAGVAVEVHSNNIHGNSAYGVFNGTTDGASETIDANGNWWGDPSGPSGQGPGTGDAISENVDATTFLSGPQSACTALSISKTDSPDPVVPGQQLTYTITVTNAGTGAATGVVVNDTLPAALLNVVTSGCDEDPSGGSTCTLGTIGGGSSASYTITGTVAANAPASITNTATLSADDIPADAFDDTATAVTTVSIAADLDIEKTLLTAGPITEGQTIEFRLEVTNNGPSDATGVVATDVLPAGLAFLDSPCATAVGNTVTWNIGALTVGTTVACQFRVTTTGQGSTINTATVTGTPADPGGSDSDSVTINVGPAAAVESIPVTGVEGLLVLAVLLGIAGTLVLPRH
ncbi:MAG: NosD domain-containing protein [Acidobacteriota bacterium]